MGSLDRVDLELLSALADDHRATVVALADRLGLSRNTVQARMLRLERSGVFHSYERAMSTQALGLPIEAMVSVMVRQADLPRITTAIAEIPEVVQAHGMSGQVDLLVRVVARDTQHLFDVDARILAIEGVERTETSLVMGEVIGYRVRPLLEASSRAGAAGIGSTGIVAARSSSASALSPASIRTSTTPTSSTAPPTNWIGPGLSREAATRTRGRRAPRCR
jgi:DNA-binding Lrp family transcriptional regulator